MDAFDADVIIYAAEAGHPLGRRVAALFPDSAPAAQGDLAGIGSLILLTEVLSKPLRRGHTAEVRELTGLLSRLELLPLDRSTAELATAMASTYDLQAADAAHLATAIAAGADRFVTNNQRDFPQSITEIDVTYPDDLPDPVPA